MQNDIKVAIVHDYLHWYGGGEKVLEALHEIFPNAPVYTSVYTKERMPKAIQKMDIRPSFMQRLPFRRKILKAYTPLYPTAFEQFDFSEYDVVFSNTSGMAKGVITSPSTCHISYTLTPPRFLWNYPTAYRKKLSSLMRNVILPPLDNYLRLWDRWASDRVDYFIADSLEVQARIKKFYRRDSTVIYPPVNTKPFQTANPIEGKYFLTVSRLEAFKNVDLAVKACGELNLPLYVIGDGPMRKELEKLNKGNVTFLGKVSDSDVVKYMQECKAVIFPGADDFGIVPVEAMAAGKPVIALREGGAVETIIEEKTGEFFNNATEYSLKAVLSNFNTKQYNPLICMRQASKFDSSIFKQQIERIVYDCLYEYRKVF